MKALCHPVSENKNFEEVDLCSYFLTCDPCYIRNIKALHLLVSEKKNFEVFLLCPYVSNL